MKSLKGGIYIAKQTRLPTIPKKVKRECWKTGYRNVIRDKKGHFVSWGKWSPKNNKRVFQKLYQEKKIAKLPPIREKYKYNFAVYTSEDTEDGTGVKDELYIKNFVSDLNISELDETYRQELLNVLKDSVGHAGSDFVDKGNIVLLKQEKTFAPKSEYFEYDANVININPNADEKKYKFIRTKKGSHKC